MTLDEHARLSVAPMMDWTDRHCRAFHRVLSRNVLLYTEMVTAAALVRGGAMHLLRFDMAEHPVALQLGGSDPAELAEACRMAVAHGYAEVNLNVGCPSDRVQSGSFGAILMETPELVADCLRAMSDAAGDVPVTMKCRIGVDDQKAGDVLPDLLARMSDAGVSRVTVHARMAWLKGLSPKENREVPPLDYDLVHAMKTRFPDLHLSINGGIATMDDAVTQLQIMDGVMIGRAAYHDPGTVLMNADSRIFGAADPQPDRVSAALAMVPHIEAHLADGGKLGQVTRHMLGLFAGLPGARSWRRTLSEGAARPGAGVEVLRTALDHVIDAAA
ncbi:tRNA dihydrouridine(20/20a) synthase DusA [Jannaschia donghaensis]|uniref:tRNA-dihydrouridine(20/20a) synthase n=1 Tax=Jannaschia donghaensis TaxID=420998 RepID=A0A0M6YLX6_9RHOB|nr:tRNA dihydrouridine(20/20a) synthase DusA [Jannaschia donghaensis]CTQ50645.1 putative tRNA-dihydrouridine synthase [Jannaschia donghaensis]